jgi:hypothetical protein
VAELFLNKNTMKKVKKILLFLFTVVIISFSNIAFSQITTVSTYVFPDDTTTGRIDYANALVTFNIENTNDSAYVLRQVEYIFNHYHAGVTTVPRLWYSSSSLGGSTIVSENNGWSVITTGSPFTIGSSYAYYPLFQNLAFTIPAHTQYRFAVESSGGLFLYGDEPDVFPSITDSNGIYLKVCHASSTPGGNDTVGCVAYPPNQPVAEAIAVGFTGRITLEPATTTPVTLLNLTATYNNKNANIINWQTSQEINSRSFTLQKAYTPPFFSNVTTLPAAGNSSTIQNYTYTDNSIEYRTTYYRLLQTDKDGKSSYSKTVSVTPTAKSFAISNLYPSPAQSTITIEYNSPAQAATALTVTDMLGKQVQKSTWPSVKGFNKKQLNVAALPKGKYIVVLNNGTEQVQTGFVKE